MTRLAVSEEWRNWRPEHHRRCDICGVPVAPISVGWAAIAHTAADIRHDPSPHTHTVNGQEH